MYRINDLDTQLISNWSQSDIDMLVLSVYLQKCLEGKNLTATAANIAKRWFRNYTCSWQQSMSPAVSADGCEFYDNSDRQIGDKSTTIAPMVCMERRPAFVYYHRADNGSKIEAPVCSQYCLEHINHSLHSFRPFTKVCCGQFACDRRCSKLVNCEAKDHRLHFAKHKNWQDIQVKPRSALNGLCYYPEAQRTERFRVPIVAGSQLSI